MSKLRKTWRSGDHFLVRHKDTSIIVVEKRAGLLTVPTPTGRGLDLMSLVEDFLGSGSHRGTALAVHRLDKVVSGLLVIARNERSLQSLMDQFAAHTPHRAYIAVVDGLLPDDEGTFESYLKSHPKSFRVSSSHDGSGKHAVTHWKVLQRFEDAGATAVEALLETGVRNQIRVHFAEAGFALLGERKYLDADHPEAKLAQGNRRIFLHAARLEFAHPKTGRLMKFDAPLPPELERWKRSLYGGKKRQPGTRAPAKKGGANSAPQDAAASAEQKKPAKKRKKPKRPNKNKGAPKRLRAKKNEEG